MFPNLIKWSAHRLTGAALSSRSYHDTYRLRRALLYVPGDSERKLQKTLNLNVDCVALDCEDGVATSQKQAARESIRSFLQSPKPNTSIEWSVRVNSLESGLLADDLSTILSGKVLPETLLLPKVNDITTLDNFSNILKQHIKSKEHKINLIMYAESCKAVMNLPQICNHGIELSKNSPFELSGIVFGSDDFCADLGVVRTKESTEILYARQKVVLVSKAFKLQAIDMVHIDFKNLEDLRLNCLEGARLGYTGKQVIHPQQIDIVQECFLPNKKVIAWARGLLDAYEQHQKSGKGAFVYENQMIDAPTMKQARNIVELMEKTNRNSAQAKAKYS